MKKILLILLSAFVLITTMACSCSLIGFDHLYNSLPDVVIEAGSGNVIQKEVELSNDVREVEINSIGIVHFIQGENAELVIEAEDNYIDRIEVQIIDNRLVISIENKWFESWVPTKTIHYYLTLPELTDLQLNGAVGFEMDELVAGNLHMECNGTSSLELGELVADNITVDIAGAAKLNADNFESNTLTINIDGVSNVDIKDLQAQSLTIDISGGGAIDLAGSVSRQEIDIDGAGSYQAGDLRSDTAVIYSAGAALITVWVEESLDMECDGAARVSYYGTPSVYQNNSGLAVVESLGAKEE
ncbi:MAG: DUF2807 domain-containing protein [Anaerolineaceae bacterium]|nr:DUF2807 domain-containing protein [Anaerolineaceae bacterium]